MKAFWSRSILYLALLFLLPALRAEAGVNVGTAAPPLTLKKVLQAPEGTLGTWGELRGRAVVLEFWATWCGACVDNIPHLNELAEKFKGRPVQFISITDEDSAVVGPFLEKYPIAGWIALDADASTFKTYEVEGRPPTVLVDAGGAIRAITNPVSVTPQVLEDLLAGKSLNFPEVSLEPPLGAEPGAPSPLIQVLIRPAAPIAVSGTSPGGVMEKGGRYDSYGRTLPDILAEIYHVPETRVDAPEWCSRTRYDFSVVTPQHEEALRWPLVQQAFTAAFHLKVHLERRETSVYILRRIPGQHPKLRPAATEQNSGNKSLMSGRAESFGLPFERLISVAHFVLNAEIFNETGLKDRYAFDLKWDPKKPTSIVAAIREQLGLELAPVQKRLEHLVVDSVEEPKTW